MESADIGRAQSQAGRNQRAARSGPVMEELHVWLTAQLQEKKAEPNSGLGQAISYLLNHWRELTLFLRQPRAPLDNNVCTAASGSANIMPTAGLCRVGAGASLFAEGL
jgi:hypothetical protein